MMGEWLGKEKIKTFALELITPEFIDVVEDRINYLKDEYDKDNKKRLIDKIVIELEQCLHTFTEIVNRTKISLITDINRPPITRQELDNLKNSLKIPTTHFVMYHIKGIKSELTWNDVNSVIEQVKEAKKKIDGDSNITHNSIKEKQNNTFIESIETMDDLLKGKSEIYTNLLKTTLEEKENKIRILSDNSWIKGRKIFSIVIAWMDSLQQAKKFKMSNISEQQKAQLINNYFKDFNMNEDELSLWRKHGPTYRRYKEIFDREIIKLDK